MRTVTMSQAQAARHPGRYDRLANSRRTMAELRHDSGAVTFVVSGPRLAQVAIGLGIAIYLLAGVYALLATTGSAPATPWSPIGQQQQHHDAPAPAPTTSSTTQEA